VFNLVEDCQDFLRDHNAAAQQRALAAAAQAAAAAAQAAADGSGAGTGLDASGGSGAGGAAQSLWHQMQQRLADERQQEAQEAARLLEETSASAAMGAIPEELWVTDEGLFTEEGGWRTLQT
jgi:hypothetical protein